MTEQNHHVEDLHPTERFTTRAQDYALFRPRYPAELMQLLRENGAIRPNMVVADIGSGTGILTEQLLREGCEVFAIEPNKAMRMKAEELLGNLLRFHSIDSRAEDTMLPEASVDLIAIGQAFHWFDLTPTRVEFLRILKPEGFLCLVWNSRDPTGGDFEEEYKQLVEDCCPANKQVKDLGPGEQEIAEFYGGEHIHVFLPNHQDLDLHGLKGRFMSASSAPNEHEPSYMRAIAGLEQLFEKHKADGKVRLHYRTEVYLGRLKRH